MFVNKIFYFIYKKKKEKKKEREDYTKDKKREY